MQDENADQRSSEAPTVAGPQTPAGVTPREPPAIAPRVLDDPQLALLAAALNRIVPPEGAHPGAGDLGVAATIHRTIAASPALLRLFCEGIAAIDIEAAGLGGGAAFVDLSGGEQDRALRAVEEAHPGFFGALVDHTYRGYYTHPRVYRAIGYDHRPPQPLGYELPLFNPAMLAKQRGRKPFWRQVE